MRRDLIKYGLLSAGLVTCIILCVIVFRKASEAGSEPRGTPTITATTVPQGSPLKIEEAAASVVRLEVYDKSDERIAVGSGFAAMPDPVLVTARHVVVNMKYMIATRDDGTTFRVERILAVDEDSDVALCELPADANLKPLPVERNVPKRGTKVYAVGSQFGLINLVSDGIVSGTWESGDVKRVVFSAPVSGGSSGGPLLNEAGNVIGIVTGTYEKGQNLNLAAYADVIYALNH